MHFLSDLLPSIRHIGVFGYWIAFALSFAESLPFIGYLFPGTFIVLLFGFVASQGVLHFRSLVWFIAIGAVLGDAIGYWFGTKGKRFFRSENRLLKLSHVERGERFFAKHGQKSVFLSRFIGPLRPVVPFVAGLSRMGWQRFLLWDVLAALLWSWIHLTLGFFFGGAATVLETWFTRGSIFLLAAVALLVLLWYVAKWLRPFVRVVVSVVRSMWEAATEHPDVQAFLHRHPKSVAFIRGRFDRKRFSGRPLTLLSIAFTYLVFLLSGVIEGVVTAEPIVSVDARVANLMYAFRDTGFIHAFLWVTLLGRNDTVVLIAVATVIGLVFWNRRSYILPFLITLAGSQLFASLGKRLVHRPRPSIAYYLEPSYSFPSGHATLSVALYGFLAYVLLRNATRRWRHRTLVLFSALVLIAGVGFSRLYLGVHYLSDVWGGYLLGSLWLVIGISIAELKLRRRPDEKAQDIPAPEARRRRYATAFLIIAPILFYAYQGSRYAPKRVAVDRGTETETSDDVIGAFSRLGLPRYSETFTGKHQEPLSFIIVAKDDDAFVAAMETAGWKLSDPVTIANMASLAGAAISKSSYPRAPMTPSFWNTRVHDFGFQKETSDGTVRARHHARFWKTPIRTEDGGTVYAGTASLDVGIKWIVTHRISPDIDTERETLFGDLVATGRVVSSEKFRFVDPVLGKNFSGDPFFTDGEAYVIRFE